MESLSCNAFPWNVVGTEHWHGFNGSFDSSPKNDKLIIMEYSHTKYKIY